MEITAGVPWGLGEMSMRGLAQAVPGMWWAPSLFAYYVLCVSWIKKTLQSEYQGKFSEWLSRPGFGLCESRSLAHLSVHCLQVEVSMGYITLWCKSGVWFQTAYRYCQAHSWSKCVWGHMTYFLRMTLGEFLRTIWCLISPLRVPY